MKASLNQHRELSFSFLCNLNAHQHTGWTSEKRNAKSRRQKSDSLVDQTSAWALFVRGISVKKSCNTFHLRKLRYHFSAINSSMHTKIFSFRPESSSFMCISIAVWLNDHILRLFGILLLTHKWLSHIRFTFSSIVCIMVAYCSLDSNWFWIRQFSTMEIVDFFKECFD